VASKYQVETQDGDVRLRLDRPGVAAVSQVLTVDEVRDLIGDLAGAAGLAVAVYSPGDETPDATPGVQPDTPNSPQGTAGFDPDAEDPQRGRPADRMEQPADPPH
jgi:hypothetical protein